jgi:hypothetical protein
LLSLSCWNKTPYLLLLSVAFPNFLALHCCQIFWHPWQTVMQLFCC